MTAATALLVPSPARVGFEAWQRCQFRWDAVLARFFGRLKTFGVDKEAFRRGDDTSRSRGRRAPSGNRD